KLTETVGKVFEREGCVLKIDTAGEVRIGERTVGFDPEGCCTAGSQVGVDGFGQLEIDGSVGCEVELALGGKIERRLYVDIGLLSGDVERFEADERVAHGGVQTAIAVEVHT